MAIPQGVSSGRTVPPAAPSAPQSTGADNAQSDISIWSPEGKAAERIAPEAWLVARGYLDSRKLEEAKRLQQASRGRKLMQVLLDMGAAEETHIQQAIATSMRLNYFEIDPKDLDRRVVDLLPQDFMRARGCIALEQHRGGPLTLGMVDPANVFLLDDVQRRTGAPAIVTVVVSQKGILAALEAIQASGDSPHQEKFEDILSAVGEDDLEILQDDVEDVTDLAKASGESPVIRLVNYLIFDAVKQGASDIHIEPREKRLVIRYRIDGALFDAMSPPAAMHAACVSRLKIMANMDISERRLPQDGRIRTVVHGRSVDLRVSTLPTQHGEKTVIRILDNRSIMLGLEQLGFSEDTLTILRKQIDRPNGMVLVTGPTGSGKTTTLYSCLRCMDGNRMNISTVEDPIEYQLAFANQVQVNDRIGMTFPTALKALLRQDPDVIMLGEIRDAETAHTAVQAALTGHLVLSTLHTNDAPSSITRLINIGLEPYLISAALNGVLAQRLVRRICSNCKESVRTTDEAMREFLENNGFDPDAIFRGKGCEKCRNTGYRGRVGIYEMLVLDDVARDLVVKSPNVSELRRICKERGMVTLRDDGMQKIAAGLTTVEEVMGATENTV
jgi:type IV pilus assembly protein PilB